MGKMGDTKSDEEYVYTYIHAYIHSEEEMMEKMGDTKSDEEYVRVITSFADDDGQEYLVCMHVCMCVCMCVCVCMYVYVCVCVIPPVSAHFVS